MSKYSIILPVRNGGTYVKECVHSILAQTLPDFNLIVLDNCSSDGTTEWIQSLQENRIVLHPSEKSLTIEENWHRIIDIPKNEFMTMIGHDDILGPHYLEEMNRLIVSHPTATLFQAHYDFIDGNGKEIRPCLPMDETQYAHEFLACQMARTMESMGTGYMMRSRDYDDIGGMPSNYPNLIFADYELWIKLMLRGYKATTLRKCFSYRVHMSLSRTTNGALYQEAFGKYIYYLKELMQKDQNMQLVITRYGKQMLMYYCESLSHRLLKTPGKERSFKVAEFIRRCEWYAREIIPEQHFKPLERFRIRIAKQLDDFVLGRTLFNVFKKLT